MSRSRLIVTACLGILAVAALAALLRLGGSTSSDEAGRLAQQLSCPACAGQSVADSNSAVAESMRAVIADQVARGKSEDEIRDWFAQRYGQQVLRASSRHDSILLWGIPSLVAAVAAVGAAVTLRGRHPVVEAAEDGRRPRQRQAVFVAVGAAVGLMIGAVAVASRALDTAPEPHTVATAPTTPPPGGAPAPLTRAFTLLRSGKPQPAAEMAEAVRASDPDNPDALLVLGLARRAMAQPEADDILQRFLALDPQHPAAAEVRALLDQPVTTGRNGDAVGQR